MQTSARTGCALMLLSAVTTAALALFLFGCATPAPVRSPGSLIDELCATRGPGLHQLDDHSQLWCGRRGQPA
jgi:hypothetical protein